MQLKDFVKIAKFTLDNGLAVEIKETVTAGEFAKIRQQKEADILSVALACMITEWNMEDDAGGPLPITKENLDKLPMIVLKDVFERTEFGKTMKQLGDVTEKKTE